MQIQEVSDLHVDTWRNRGLPIRSIEILPGTRVLVVAGDVSNTMQTSLNWCNNIAKANPDIDVIFVPGNHDFYGSTLDPLTGSVDMRSKVTNWAANFHTLEDSAVIIDDVVFYGATLWTDAQLFGPVMEWAAREAVEKGLLDYRRVRLESGHFIGINTTINLHERSVRNMRAFFRQDFGGKKRVVVTHHAPSRKSVHERYDKDLVSAGFASNLDDIAALADVWIHGHTHSDFDYLIDECRVVCTPLGYPNENAEDPELYVGKVICLDSTE